MILQQGFPESLFLQDYAAKMTVLLLVSDLICEHPTSGPELYDSGPMERHLLLSPVKSIRNIRI